MLKQQTLAERSRIYLSMLEALDCNCKAPTTAQTASAEAYAEAVAFYSGKSGIELSNLLCAANAAMDEVERQKGSRETEVLFDIPSLQNAIGFDEYEAVLVARLCGAFAGQRRGETVWKNTKNTAELISFPKNMFMPADQV